MLKKAIFFGAHDDDVEIGCAGTAIKLKKKKFKIYKVIISSSGFKDEYGKTLRQNDIAEKEALRANKIIGFNECINLNEKTNEIIVNDLLKSKILKIINRINPSHIFVHWSGDVHHDHRVVSELVLGLSKRIENVYLYRSNFFKSKKEFNGNIYIDITKEYKKKISSIEQYKTELKRVKNSWLKMVENENKINGYRSGCKYAECFEVIRSKIL